MEANYILIRFGELTTKGKNRKLFTQKLLKNTKEMLGDFAQLTYQLQHDRMYVMLNGEDKDEVIAKLKNVFGIYSFSVAYKVNKDLEEAKKAAEVVINNNPGTTFKINTVRSDKNFPGSSMEINRQIAGHVFNHVDRDLKVDVHNPEILVRIEIRHDAIYVMDNTIRGAGGYPVGVGGKSLLMLSGGIDSPVAGYLTMKRGVDIDCIHYAAPPYTNEQAKAKVVDLANVLRRYGHNKIRVFVIPFTRLQLAVYDNCDESYAMTVMRRMMYRIAEKLAQKNHCLALVNGESIGQVASQTLHSMQTINEVIKMPVIRPVVCMDKLEIIDIAQKIDTYDISIRPHEDCCTIFTPKQPATKPRAHIAQEFEAKFDFATLVDECVENAELLVIDENYFKTEEDEFF